MTYPRTPEEKARSLGSRLACEAFNACGSLDAKKCQEVGDAFGKAIAELVEATRDRLLETVLDEWSLVLEPEADAPLPAGTTWAEFDRALTESFLKAVL